MNDAHCDNPICRQNFDHKISDLERKYEVLCKRIDSHHDHGNRITVVEHDIDRHQRDLNGNVEKWKNHENFAKERIDKQEAKDKEMETDINELKLALRDLTGAITNTKSEIKTFFHRTLLGIAGSAILLTLGLAGTLFMSILNFKILKG